MNDIEKDQGRTLEDLNEDLDSELSDSPDYSNAIGSSDTMDDVEISGDEEVEDDGEEVVFDEPSILNEYGLTEEEMAEIDELDSEPEYETSLLEDLEPAWEQITEDTVEFMLSEHAEEAEIAAQHAILHLAVEQIQEELGEADHEEISQALETYDFSEDEPFYDAVKFGYLMGIEAASRRIVPQFIETQCVAEYVSEAAEHYSDYATGTYSEMVEEADAMMDEFHSEAIEVVEGMLEENANLQTRVNILESEAVIAEECKDLTAMQRSEIQGLILEAEIPANDTFNLSDFRTKIKRMKLKYHKTPKTGLHDTSFHNPKASNSKLMNGVEDALRKTRR